MKKTILEIFYLVVSVLSFLAGFGILILIDIKLLGATLLILFGFYFANKSNNINR